MSDMKREDELARLIIATLRTSSKPLLAREIASLISGAYGMKVKRKEVNSCLYGRILKKQVIQDTNFRWSFNEYPEVLEKTNEIGSSASSLDKQKAMRFPKSITSDTISGARGGLQDLATTSRAENHGISVEKVQRVLKYDFVEAEISSPCFFHIRNFAGRLDVVLNLAHPISDGIEGLLTTSESEDQNLALKTLKVLLKAWAKLEDDAEGQRRQALEDARLDWGRIARDFLQDGND